MATLPAAINGFNPRLASLRHTGIFIMIFLGCAVLGMHYGLPGAAPEAKSTSAQLKVYLSLLAMEYGLYRFVLGGLRAGGHSAAEIIGTRLTDRRGLLRDIGTGLLLTVLSLAIQAALDWIFPATAPRVFATPDSLLEIGVWIVLSGFAGVCEEFAFRGYLQNQLKSVTGSLWLSIVIQALVFAVGHAYQGFEAVARIVVFGLMFGIAATRCRNLRPLMLAHALTDVVAGMMAS
jgi:membrane protease YdiL (CAAX protease family)